ncbi:MAG: PEP/pyruvate-binding domain-containing protein [Chloroflexota bacterium]
MDAYVVPLGELDHSAVAIAGGKAANLGELRRAGFAVPDGFCVTTLAYNRLLEAAGLRPRLAGLLSELAADGDDVLPRVGAAIRDLFYRAEVPAEIATQIAEAAQALGSPALAVRSSATAEDLPEASFAGQQETYLNVSGPKALREAVRRCWASLWTDRAIAYRQRNGIAHEGVALAVVCQEMVAAEVAGVLFTANPVSGRRLEVVIDASLGLGEAVVGGLVSPDNYVVDKQDLRITARRVSAKNVQVVASPRGGTAQAPVEATRAQMPALPDEAIHELARTAIAVEQHYGQPQDVEWAFAAGKLYILQSRPITSLFPAPPPRPDGQYRIYMSLNTAQGMLEPFTPLGGSTLATLANEVFVGEQSDRKVLVELGGRIYADVTDLLRNRLGRHLPTAFFPEIEPVMARILVTLLADPRLGPYPESSRHVAFRLLRRGWPSLRRFFWSIMRNLLDPARARRRVDEVMIPYLRNLREEVRRPVPLGGQADVARRAFRGGLGALLFPNLLPLVVPGVASYKQAEMIVRRLGLSEELYWTARQGLPYNRTTLMDLDLWALARQAQDDTESSALLRGEEPSALAARYREGSLPGVLQQGMGDFLARYGHRGVREIDIGIPRWAEEPTYLFAVLRGYVDLPEEGAPDHHFAAQVAAGERAARELVAQARKQPGGFVQAKRLGFFLGRFRQLGGLRETPKFLITWLFQALREMMLAAGDQLVAQGRLERREDVFFLHFTELGRLGQDDLPVAQLVAERKREYERELKRPRAPRVVTSEGEAFYGEPLAADGGGLVGAGASPGVVRGRARVIRDPLGAKLAAGEILVAPSTDPAWTPLFLAAGGLVMEAGGAMSHGSIVAREYGIPAVVGLPEATTRIADGREIEVDGNRGVVRLIAPAAETAAEEVKGISELA